MPGVAGSLLGFKMNGSFTSCEISCSIKFDRENLPASAVDSGGWKEWIYGIRSWSITVSGNLLLQAAATDIKSILNTGYFGSLPMYVQFSTSPAADVELVFSGLGMFNTADIQAASTANSQWNCTINGNGELKMTAQEYPLLISAMPAEATYPTIIESGLV